MSKYTRRGAGSDGKRITGEAWEKICELRDRAETAEAEYKASMALLHQALLAQHKIAKLMPRLFTVDDDGNFIPRPADGK